MPDRSTTSGLRCASHDQVKSAIDTIRRLKSYHAGWLTTQLLLGLGLARPAQVVVVVAAVGLVVLAIVEPAARAIASVFALVVVAVSAAPMVWPLPALTAGVGLLAWFRLVAQPRREQSTDAAPELARSRGAGRRAARTRTVDPRYRGPRDRGHRDPRAARHAPPCVRAGRRRHRPRHPVQRADGARRPGVRGPAQVTPRRVTVDRASSAKVVPQGPWCTSGTTAGDHRLDGR